MPTTTTTVSSGSGTCCCDGGGGCTICGEAIPLTGLGHLIVFMTVTSCSGAICGVLGGGTKPNPWSNNISIAPSCESIQLSVICQDNTLRLHMGHTYPDLGFPEPTDCEAVVTTAICGPFDVTTGCDGTFEEIATVTTPGPVCDGSGFVSQSFTVTCSRGTFTIVVTT